MNVLAYMMYNEMNKNSHSLGELRDFMFSHYSTEISQQVLFEVISKGVTSTTNGVNIDG